MLFTLHPMSYSSQHNHIILLMLFYFLFIVFPISLPALSLCQDYFSLIVLWVGSIFSIFRNTVTIFSCQYYDCYRY